MSPPAVPRRGRAALCGLGLGCALAFGPPTIAQAAAQSRASLSEAVHTLDRFATERRITVEVDVGASTASSATLQSGREAVIELVANAIAIAPEQGHIRVRCEADVAVIWIEKPSVAQDLWRTLLDTKGHRFEMRAFRGQGVELRRPLQAETKE